MRLSRQAALQQNCPSVALRCCARAGVARAMTSTRYSCARKASNAEPVTTRGSPSRRCQVVPERQRSPATPSGSLRGRLLAVEQDFGAGLAGSISQFVGEPNGASAGRCRAAPCDFRRRSRSSPAHRATASDALRRQNRGWGSRGRGFKSRRPDAAHKADSDPGRSSGAPLGDQDRGYFSSSAS